jgi:L-cysteine:1D-myo-inositol 2-amino-2-deoxy-alpha-D-glucopyranoside ligase
MNSWAALYLPPIDSKFTFPALELKDSSTDELVALPIKKEYKMYVCGITPYDATHLGHAATYITFDLVNRYLRAMGKTVHFVENVTDVDDPLLERANRDKVDWNTLAQSQIDLFRGDMSDLHVIPPEHYIGVVESIPLVVDAIKDLQSKNAIYPLEEDLYFSVRTDEKFGTRAHLSQDEMLKLSAERGGDPSRFGKHDPLDALVWLHEKPGEPSWPSEFGNGRPGWHIECAAIALAYLPVAHDDTFLIDIQGGGSDLLFPHHEMSAAQAGILKGKEYSRIYIHAGLIGLDGEKMSKSRGNLVFLSKLISEGADPLAVRLALMSEHYSLDRMWSDDHLLSATQLLDRLRLLLSRPEVAPTSIVVQNIINALSMNLDTPQAIKILETWCRDTESGVSGGSAGELSRAIDSLLGIAI